MNLNMDLDLCIFIYLNLDIDTVVRSLSRIQAGDKNVLADWMWEQCRSHLIMPDCGCKCNFACLPGSPGFALEAVSGMPSSAPINSGHR